MAKKKEVIEKLCLHHFIGREMDKLQARVVKEYSEEYLDEEGDVELGRLKSDFSETVFTAAGGLLMNARGERFLDIKIAEIKYACEEMDDHVCDHDLGPDPDDDTGDDDTH